MNTLSNLQNLLNNARDTSSLVAAARTFVAIFENTSSLWNKLGLNDKAINLIDQMVVKINYSLNLHCHHKETILLMNKLRDQLLKDQKRYIKHENPVTQHCQAG